MTMHHTKLLGAAVAALLLVVALAGAAPASATRLCRTNTAPCTNVYIHTEFHADLLGGTTSVMTTSGGIVNPTLTCTITTLRITNTNAGGGEGVPVAVRLTSLSFTGCTSTSPTGCESQGTVGSLAASSGTITHTTGVNGTLRFAVPPITFSCPILGSTATCHFSATDLIDGTVTGGQPAVIDIVNQPFHGSGFGCPTSMQWNARYGLTNHPLYVTTS